MEQTDKQFKVFLRMLIARIRSAVEEEDPEKAKKRMREILDDQQASLEN